MCAERFILNNTEMREERSSCVKPVGIFVFVSAYRKGEVLKRSRIFEAG